MRHAYGRVVAVRHKRTTTGHAFVVAPDRVGHKFNLYPFKYLLAAYIKGDGQCKKLDFAADSTARQRTSQEAGSRLERKRRGDLPIPGCAHAGLA